MKIIIFSIYLRKKFFYKKGMTPQQLSRERSMKNCVSIQVLIGFELEKIFSRLKSYSARSFYDAKKSRVFADRNSR